MRGSLKARLCGNSSTRTLCNYRDKAVSPDSLFKTGSRKLTVSTVRRDEQGNLGKRKTATWPTAESVILQRISSTGAQALPSPAKTGKEVVPVAGDSTSSSSPLSMAGGDAGVAGQDEAQDLAAAAAAAAQRSGVQSVSGIINGLREARAASQRPRQAARAPDPDDSKHSTTEQRSAERTEPDDDEGPRLPYCLFDTHELVVQLAAAGFAREQATTLMTLVKHRVHEDMELVGQQMLTKSDLENDAYLFRAALQELRTETQMIRKNDQALLESQAAGISRDIDSLAQRTNDEIGNLRSDIAIELNNHRHETSHEMKSLDMELHELSSKYQVVMGEMKTDIEAIKLESIRRGLLTAVLTTLFLGALLWTPDLVQGVRDRASGPTGERGDAGTSATGAELPGDLQGPEPKRTAKPAADDVAYSNPDPVVPRSRDAAMPMYREHSHLDIRYEPAELSPDEGKPPESYDDWFDSVFYSPQTRSADNERGNTEGSAEGSAKGDVGRPEHEAAAPAADIDNKQEQSNSEQCSPEKAEKTDQMPLYYTYEAGSDTAPASSTEKK
ncbi:hypothetical protein GGI07_005093 [Coemansia sp. Benny D115]|nr:hypothetical protein GGI07_005093 [Coemansia sp. Benny D115]